jgi:hypothetical protein
MLVHSLFLFFGSNVDFVNCKILGDWVLFSVSFLLKDQKTKQNKKVGLHLFQFHHYLLFLYLISYV